MFSLSAAFQAGAFVGEYGSRDRTPVNGYKVVFVPFEDGQSTGPPKDVVTGFLSGDDQANGRPVALDHDGAPLLADHIGHTVWRVTAAGQ